MAYSNECMCCGVHEIDELSIGDPPEVSIHHLYEESFKENWNGEKWRHRAGLFFFTQAEHKQNAKTYGHEFAEYIRKKQLGRVASLPDARNQNSGNYVKMWMWRPNWARIDKLCVNARKEDE